MQLINKQTAGKSWFYSVVLLSIAACVVIKAPEGGAKDTLPPKLVKAIPAHESVGFKPPRRRWWRFWAQKPTITLTFDKPIEGINIYHNLVFTPALPLPPADKKGRHKKAYTYQIAGNRLHVYLHKTVKLAPETTYVLNLNRAIQSREERRVAEKIKIAFSTGEKLDACTITGEVKSLLTEQPTPNCFVSLYDVAQPGKAAEEASIFTSPPAYLAKADEEGRFKISYVKPGRYRLYASDAINFHPDEKKSLDVQLAGFQVAPLVVQDQLKNVTVYTIKHDVNSLKFLSAQARAQYFEIEFNKPIKHYALSLTKYPSCFTQAPQLLSKLTKQDKVIQIYDTLYDPVSHKNWYMLAEDQPLSVECTACDNLGTTLTKTVSLRATSAKNKPDSLSVTLANVKVGTHTDPYLHVVLKLSKPVKRIDKDKICLRIKRASVEKREKQKAKERKKSRRKERLRKKMGQKEEEDTHEGSSDEKKEASADKDKEDVGPKQKAEDLLAALGTEQPSSEQAEHSNTKNEQIKSGEALEAEEDDKKDDDEDDGDKDEDEEDDESFKLHAGELSFDRLNELRAKKNKKKEEEEDIVLPNDNESEDMLAKRQAAIDDERMIKIPIAPKHITLNTRGDEIHIKHPIDLKRFPKGVKQPFFLYLAYKAVHTVDNDKFKRIKQEFKLQDPERVSTIQGTVTTAAPGLIIELLARKKADKHYTHTLIETIRNQKNYQFANIPPGEYQIRVFALRSTAPEAYWHSGNVQQRITPDPMLLHPKLLQVKKDTRMHKLDIVLDAPPTISKQSQ